jgi:hypothetical protein
MGNVYLALSHAVLTPIKIVVRPTDTIKVKVLYKYDGSTVV